MSPHFRQHIGAGAVLVCLVCLYVAIRLLNLDLFVTTDEPFWLGRSANFFRALRQGDLVHTYQMAHPGVLTMWAGAFAYLWIFPDYANLAARNLDHVYGIGAVLRDLGQDPLQLLVAARIAKILVQGVLFGISLALIQRLFGRAVMVVSGLLIVCDPFLSGMDSLLHVDGLFAISSFAAILAIAVAARSQPDAMAPWVMAGVLAACAWMTRAPGLILVAILGGVAVVHVVCHLRTGAFPSLRSALEPPAFAIMLWATGAMAMSLLLLPALWVDPFGTMQRIWDWSTNAAVEGHERPTFFLGESHFGDPGVWFYPVTLIWRLTPVSIVGILILLMVAPVAFRRRWLPTSTLHSLGILLAFAVTYAGAMSFAAKKFDRYILPVYPIVSVIAAVGIVVGARWMSQRFFERSRMVLPAMTMVFIAGQALALASAVPYRLDYFNPMLGGLATAQNHVQVGWGEGGREAIEFVEDHAGGRDVTIQVSSAMPVFSYFAAPNLHFERFGLNTPEHWYETDYFITGIQEWQRGLSPSREVMLAYDSAFTMSIDGVPFFEVYTPGSLPPPSALRAATGCSATFGGDIELMQIVGRDGTIDFYWLSTGDDPAQYEVSVSLSLNGQTGEALPEAESQWLAPAGELMSKSTVTDPRADNAAPLIEYTMTIQVRDAATHELLQVTGDPAGANGDSLVTNAACHEAGP